MPLQRKSRFGAAFIIIGSLLAVAGESINARDMDVLGSSWHIALGLIISGTFILLIGLLPFAVVSEQINGLGFLGSMLILPGGLLLIIGTAALDWIILPFLLNLGNALAAAINGPTTKTQDTLNKIISGLNGLEDTINKILPHAVPRTPAVSIPKANGIDLMNKALVELHLPTIERLTWWGHFSLSGGTLTLGCLILGIALLRRMAKLSWPGIVLIVFALLNLLCQFDTALPPFTGNITAIVLFLTLAWLGVSEWRAKGLDTPIYRVVEKL